MSDVRFLVGDCAETLAEVPEKSVRCCVTSPPYYGLRDYGVDGQIGLEQTPEAYVERLVAVFREVRRVLTDDGTLWLNLGDSYARLPSKGGSGPNGKNQHRWGYGAAQGTLARTQRHGLADKQLLGIPWRVALALQADGWYLRSDVIWHKPNAMPESVRDRPTKCHEYLFLLAKSSRYYFNAKAIEEATPDGNTRNARSVWSVPTRPYKEAHFAVFPVALAEKPVLAGSECGDTVLDPFCGSGTTAVAALRHARKAILCDLNPSYVELAQRRIFGGGA